MIFSSSGCVLLKTTFGSLLIPLSGVNWVGNNKLLLHELNSRSTHDKVL